MSAALSAASRRSTWGWPDDVEVPTPGRRRRSGEDGRRAPRGPPVVCVAASRRPWASGRGGAAARAGSRLKLVEAGVVAELLVDTLSREPWNRSVRARSGDRLVGGRDQPPSPKHPRFDARRRNVALPRATVRATAGGLSGPRSGTPMLDLGGCARLRQRAGSWPHASLVKRTLRIRVSMAVPCQYGLPIDVANTHRRLGGPAGMASLIVEPRMLRRRRHDHDLRRRRSPSVPARFDSMARERCPTSSSATTPPRRASGAILRVQLPPSTAGPGPPEAATHYEQAGPRRAVARPRPTDGASPAWPLYVVGHPQVVA